MNPYWSEVARRLTPYVPGEQPAIAGLVKLNTNENPYGPSPRALEAIIAEANEGLRLYPDPNASRLREAVARHHGLDPRQVFAGNGSDEVLAHAFRALFGHEGPVLMPDVGYSFYPVYCGLYGIDFVRIPLTETFEIRVEDYLRPNGGIVLANPNAPTGRALAAAQIERLVCANAGSVVLIDEAYVDFGADSAVGLIARFPNLLVVHTLSKSRSLAGLRVGFALGDAGLIEALDRVKNSFNSYPLGRLAIAGAIAAIEDREHFETTRRRVMASREKLSGELRALGFEVLPSAANFVFARHPGRDAGEIAGELRRRAVLVRHFREPRIEQYLRISIGDEAQCGALVLALGEIVG